MEQLQQEHYILGSQAYITLIVEPKRADAVFARLWEWLTAFQARFSRFEPQSELSRLNHAAGQWQPVSDEMKALLQACLMMSKATDGLFNPFVLPDLQRAGYHGSWPHPERTNKRLDVSDRHIVAADSIELKAKQVRIPADSALDMGGIGKGYALDQLAERLAEQGITSFWLSLGGDVVCRGQDVQGQPWRVEIADATHPDKTIATYTNQHGEQMAIATSGVTKRKGKGWHHLIDPRTSQPSDTTVTTATAIARSAAWADVMAKCLVLNPTGSYTIEASLIQYGNGQPITLTDKGKNFDVRA